MEIKDITEISKPLVKLLKVFEDGCSWITKPLQHRRLAVVDSETLLIDDIGEFKRELTEELLNDTNAMLHSTREKDQVSNIVNIFSLAAQELQKYSDIDENRVNKEWSAMFFDYCKDVANEDIQLMWSRVLVREITMPSFISKRTLTVLKNLEAYEINMFADVCLYVHNGAYIHESADNKIDSSVLDNLKECGLMHIGYETMELQGDKQYLSFRGYALRLNLNSRVDHVNLDCHKLTMAGSQLYSILDLTSDIMYIEGLSEMINKTFGLNSEVMETMRN